jgi:hypothetical protein
MCTRYIITVVSVSSLLVVSGCQTADTHEHAAVSATSQKEPIFGGLALYSARFHTLNDLWRAMVEPFEETGYLQVFEKGDIDLAVCVRAENGIGVNALLIYSYDGLGKQWCERVYWNTGSRGSNEVIGVNVAFNKKTGLIEARSGGGSLIFRADVAALSAKQPEESFPGKAGTQFPALRTLEELETAAEQVDGQLYVFEKDKMKVGVRVQSRGAVGWKALILYTFDDIENLWSPRVIWDTGAKDVRVTFHKWSGMIEVRSGRGMLILQANISALKVRKVPWDW